MLLNMFGCNYLEFLETVTQCGYVVECNYSNIGGWLHNMNVGGYVLECNSLKFGDNYIVE